MTWRIRRCNNFSFPTSMFRFHPPVFIYAPAIVSFEKFGKYLCLHVLFIYRIFHA
jgi:hypothetical protein